MARNGWLEMIDRNPDHSVWYIERFKTMAAEGADLDGEARFVDALVARNSRILDAGCGPGRVGGRLAQLGHTVVGVDLDPVLIDEARAVHPGATWRATDLSELDLTADERGDGFDAIVCAGNVLPFLAPETRRPAIVNLAEALVDGGRLAVGFGAGRGYTFDEFRDDARAAGLREDLLFSTWDLRPFTLDSGFLVALLSREG